MGEIAKRLHRKLASKSHHLPTKAPKRRPGEPLPSGAKDIRTLIKEGCDPLHAVFLKHCESDGLDAEEFVLTGDDLEPDTGGPLNIVQPTKITTKPLSPKDQDDRIRMIFGLTSNDPLPNDPLPDVGDDTLEAYSTPSPEGAEYIAISVPAFSPAIVHRDAES